MPTILKPSGFPPEIQELLKQVHPMQPNEKQSETITYLGLKTYLTSVEYNNSLFVKVQQFKDEKFEELFVGIFTKDDVLDFFEPEELKVNNTPAPIIQSGFTPSVYQQGIDDFVVNETGHGVVDAKAGSGKTTTIMNVVVRLKSLHRKDDKFRTLLVAFNTAIVFELEKKALKLKTKTFVKINTTHSIGMAILNTFVKGTYGQDFNIEVNDNKVRKRLLAYGLVKSWVYDFFEADSIQRAKDLNGFVNVKMKAFQNWLPTTSLRIAPEKRQEFKDLVAYINAMYDLMKLCKVNLAVKKDAIREVALNYDFKDLKNRDFARLEEAFDYLYFKNMDLSLISFDDMLFIPAMELVKSDKIKYDFILADECQDLNIAQQRLLQILRKENARMLFVGDESQAIYSFAGADADSFSNLLKQENTKLLPLSVCYRCKAKILDFVRKVTLVEDIETHEPNVGGVVRAGSYKELKAGDFVICRLNAPLIELYYELINNLKPAYMQGKDTFKSELVNLIKEMNTENKMDLLTKLKTKAQMILDNLVSSGVEVEEAMENPRYSSISENISVLEKIAEQSRDVSEMRIQIEKLFSDDKTDAIILSSIHRAKGLEAERVFVLGDNLMPMERKDMNSKQKKQEWNLIYVAYTRAISELVFLNDFKFDTKNAKNWQESRRLKEWQENLTN